VVALWAARATAHDPITTKVTWSNEIGGIVRARCAGCHRSGGAAPMPLTSYEEARPWAKAIKTEVVSGRMPRGQIARGFGRVGSAAAISPFEIALITAWADGGAPKGSDPKSTDPKSGPPTGVSWPRASASSFARPDVTIRLPARAAPPDGSHATFEGRADFTGRRWITGWRFFPNDAAIVQAEFRRSDGRYLANWVPPEESVRLPTGVGAALPDGRVSVTLWYRSAGAQRDFPVGLPNLPPVLGLFTIRDRPARERDVTDVACRDDVLPATGELLSIRPSLDRRAGALGFALGPPDAALVPLVWVRGVFPDYQPTYRFDEPQPIAPGTRLLVSGDAPGCRLLVEYAR